MHDPDRQFLFANATDGTRLQVDFFWQRDRYAHRILAGVGGRELKLLESVEGSDQQDWPPSPPLQQLSIEQPRPGEHVALLVGMAGKSHWSVSVEPLAGKAGFLFDVACRRSAPGRLASTYRPLTPRPWLRVNGFAIQQQGCKLDVRALQIDQRPPLLRADEATFWFAPPTADEENGARTMRWKYCFELTTSGDGSHG